MIVSMTLLDYFAHADFVKEAQEKDQIAACWMVTDPEKQKEKKKTIIQNFNAQLKNHIIIPLDEENFERTLKGMLPAHIFNQYKSVHDEWVKAENEFKKMREEGNPRAFFIA